MSTHAILLSSRITALITWQSWGRSRLKPHTCQLCHRFPRLVGMLLLLVLRYVGSSGSCRDGCLLSGFQRWQWAEAGCPKPSMRILEYQSVACHDLSPLYGPTNLTNISILDMFLVSGLRFRGRQDAAPVVCHVLPLAKEVKRWCNCQVCAVGPKETNISTHQADLAWLNITTCLVLRTYPANTSAMMPLGISSFLSSCPHTPPPVY